MDSRSSLSKILLSVTGSAILAFGMRNIHAVSNVTEGGVLGMELLLENWFSISPSVSSFILNVICYAIGFSVLGRSFLVYSGISTVGFSLFYALFERFEPIYPSIANMPLIAAILGAVFVGVGTGFCVRSGGAASGDDALAMAISHKTAFKIENVYLISDITVLLLSLTYIPIRRIAYSLLTVFLSGRIIGVIQRYGKKAGD